MNLLNGTTWKGAKLRIGEAKPDYSERCVVKTASLRQTLIILLSLRKEREEQPQQPKKRRKILRGCVGVHAADMNPVSPSNVSKHPAWRKTPLGRLLRPMRMRPLRPLHMPSETSVQNPKITKKRPKQLPTRLRRRLLDPEAWGAEYLKGIMLEGSSTAVLNRPSEKLPTSSVEKDKNAVLPAKTALRHKSPIPASVQITEQASPSLKKIGQDSQPPTSDIAKEAALNLSLLNSLFAGDADDWGGVESLSDIDIPAEAQASTAADQPENVDESDSAPISASPVEERGSEEEVSDAIATVDNESPVESAEDKDAEVASKMQPAVQITKLKDMFAPRAEDGSLIFYCKLLWFLPS